MERDHSRAAGWEGAKPGAKGKRPEGMKEGMNVETDLDPQTRDDLFAALEETHRLVGKACAQGAPEEFYQPPENGWSGAEHLAHLVTSVNAVAKGLSMKRLVLRLLFGRARKASRNFTGIRETYREALAAGGRASGRFVPAREEPPADAAAAERARDALLARWQRAAGRLKQGLKRWDEAALDHYRLPHPLLGKLTVREMLLFTSYHNLHHAQRIHEVR